MHKHRLKPQAEKDLEKIFKYTFLTWGLQQADQYQDELFYIMQLLLDQFDLGKLYSFSIDPYRKLHVNRHLIIYRIEKETILVIRILHDSMDIEKHIK